MEIKLSPILLAFSLVLAQGVTVPASASSFAPGYQGMLVADESGNVYAWGENNRGILPVVQVSADATFLPQRVSFPNDEKIVQVANSGGQQTFMAISESGELWAWGSNGARNPNGSPPNPNNALGLGTEADMSSLPGFVASFGENGKPAVTIPAKAKFFAGSQCRRFR